MPIQNNLTASSTRKYTPNRVISGLATSITPLEGWLYDDGFGDPWWQGAAGVPYRWILTAEVSTSAHSSHLTRVPNQYNALDIYPGMWVYSDGDAKAVKVISIVSSSEFNVQCIVEDVDRYNTFSDRNMTGLGIFSDSSTIVFFELGDDGLPILNPLPDNVNISVVSQVEARFRVFNPTVENKFFQINHGFQEGQVLKIQGGQFVNATSSDIYIVGTVVAVGPGPNYFYLAPSTKLITNLEPGLPGSVGDVIYLDAATNDRTTVPGGTPLYIKMSEEVACYTVGSVENPVSFDGTSIKLNNQIVTFSGTTITLTEIIDTINLHTSSTGVTASTGSSKNVVTGSVVYPSSTPNSGFEFTVNGVAIQVTFPSIVFGASGDIGWWDIIKPINETSHLHGVFASFNANTGLVTFTNDEGGDINFTNVSPAVTSGANKSFTDMMGASLNNPASAANRLKLTRPDGGQITITDVTGSFTYDTGVKSAANGVLPIGLIVDKTMNASANYMVADIAARDALTGLRTGDQVYVQTSYDGEWALFVKTSTGWTKIADHDSSNTDAKSLSATVNFSSTSPISLGNISDGTRVVDVTVVVTTPFNDAGVTISVGYPTAQEAVMVAANVDPTQMATYENSSSYVNTSGNEQELFIYFNPGTATAGQAKVIVSYL